MEKQFKKKITWTIKNFYSVQSKGIYSDQFVVGGCKWRLKACRVVYWYSIHLEVADHESLPFGWRRRSQCLLSIADQNSVTRHKQNAQKWFDEKSPRWCGTGNYSLPMKIGLANDTGFLVNGELKIVVEIEVLEVIGKLDVPEESSSITESVDVDGFQLHSSQVGFVSHIFERHPEIASEFCPKNTNLRTGYMSLLISLIETLRQSPQELNNADIAAAYAALRSMSDAGFKLDWLEKKLDEMSAKKEKEEAGETRKQEIKKKLEDLKQKCLGLEAQLEKEEAEVSSAIAPISFDDVI